ncbi:hypothetical protein [Streptomyces sp. NPDC017673]|uniref:hypothetical protein n=1 Tax=unclassified Streptomyces TaxID=2593676 RepID=UPI0037993C94
MPTSPGLGSARPGGTPSPIRFSPPTPSLRASWTSGAPCAALTELSARTGLFPCEADPDVLHWSEHRWQAHLTPEAAARAAAVFGRPAFTAVDGHIHSV